MVSSILQPFLNDFSWRFFGVIDKLFGIVGYEISGGKIGRFFEGETHGCLVENRQQPILLLGMMSTQTPNFVIVDVF